jgi:NurA-like 5'-3' nuclease
MPAMEHIERLAAEVRGCKEGEKPEHWFVRIPVQARDGWELSLVENRHVPPAGAVTYLVRFHRNTPIMRLDMDLGYWERFVRGETDVITQDTERRIFEDLDYASHDQRAFGYPYPIKAGHDRASLTQAERVALRKMIINEAVAAGMRPQLFRNVSQATGHG